MVLTLVTSMKLVIIKIFSNVFYFPPFSLSRVQLGYDLLMILGKEFFSFLFCVYDVSLMICFREF